MHLAVLAGDAAVLLQDDGGVVVNARGAALEEREDDYHAQLLSQRAEGIGGRSGDGLGQVAEFCVFFLAEVKAVVQFLQYDQLCSLGGSLTDVALQALDVILNVGGAMLLHHANFQFSHYLYLSN